MADTIPSLFVDVFHKAWDEIPPRGDGTDGWDLPRALEHLADALLASPLADIIDFAACHELDAAFIYGPVLSPEVRALLADWRASSWPNRSRHHERR